MRSRKRCSISSVEVHQWSLNWLVQAQVFKSSGWKCTVEVVLGIVLRAAARSISLFAACRDLAHAPSDQAVRDALAAGLPKTLSVLQRRLNEAMTGELPRRLRRGSYQVAIDWHLVPYYGQPHKSRNELYYGKPRQGTKKFHAYATACIVQYGHRYTLALTWVRRHESTVTVMRRLLARIDELGIKMRCLLLDRAFFNVPVIELLQQEEVPFLMPVMFRGRPPKKGRPATGLRWIRKQKAGWYTHTMKNKKREVTVSICVGYRRHRNRKDGKQKKQKLLFAAWHVKGSPTEIRERYRKRFGIETSYRQMRQARIFTCTRNPRLRLFFLAVALILRNIWVWIHATCLPGDNQDRSTPQLSRLRFKRMLEWIAHQIVALFHDGSTPCIQWNA